MWPWLALRVRAMYRFTTVTTKSKLDHFNDLQRARDLLLRGDVVAIPTETVYGLAASIDSPEGLKKIFSLKERPFFDPLIIHVTSFKQAASLVSTWTPLADFLARTFWPGPLTLVLPKASSVNSLITSGLDTVAVRYPAHSMTQDLIELCNVPLAAPSANKFGRTSPTQPQHVTAEFPNSNLLVLDGGECEVGLESTVISVEGDVIAILRPGCITEENLRFSLLKWAHPITIRIQESTASPGHLPHHYMPKIPLVIVGSKEPSGLSAETKLKIQNETGRTARLATELELNDDPMMAARELYSEMRRVAESGADCMFVKARPERNGLWIAIWDRIHRAATLNLTDL